MAEQGVMFVGLLQQPGGGPPCFLGPWEPDELSSLHSSPSPIHRHPFSAGASPVEDPEEPSCRQNLLERDPSDPRDSDRNPRPEQWTPQDRVRDPLRPTPNSEMSGDVSTTRTQSHVLIHTSDICPDEPLAGLKSRVQNPAEAQVAGVATGSSPPPTPPPPEPKNAEPKLRDTDRELRRCWSSESWTSSPPMNHHRPPDNHRASRLMTHNNNHIPVKGSDKDKKSVTSPPPQARLQLFALYNHMGVTDSSVRFYSLRVPLRILKEAGLTTEVDAHWLDHMTQHFTSGAHLVDGFFHLGENTENGVLSVDGVFIFQSSAEETAVTSYDAIVVEQWTVVDGVVVKTDYIPLLQSLAPFGWRLMCVLPTPIVRTNSDGSLSTKQILFLQRPTLQRKRKDFKMPNLRGRNKAKKSATSESERGNASPVAETEMEYLRSGAREEEGRDGARHRDSGGGREETSPQRDDGGEVDFGRDSSSSSPPPVDEDCHENQEEETEIDRIPPSVRREKMVRWTDVCQREESDDAKTHERIKQQLSERALFSGVC